MIDGFSKSKNKGGIMSGKQPKKLGAVEEAEKFLKQILKSGGMPSKEIREKAKHKGISDSTLRRAKAKLGLKMHRCFEEGHWHFQWELPKKK